MECYICLLDFENDYAHIPSLECGCIIIVHQECWDQWNNTCIYCRRPGIQHVYIAYNEPIRNIDCGRIAIIFLLFFIIMLYLIPIRR